MSYFRRSRFDFGTDQLITELSARPWIPVDSSVGGSKTSAAGIPASYTVRRDKMIELTVRVSEDEWEALRRLLEYGQRSLSFLWFPDADEDTSYGVYLESPLAGEQSRPTRMGEFLRVFEFTLLLRNVSGVDTWKPYFEDEPAVTDLEIAAVVTVPASISADVGTATPLSTQVTNASAQAIPGVTVVYVSSDPTVATVEPDTGAVGLVSDGTADITAYANGTPSNVVTVVSSPVSPTAAYFRDTQAGGVFGSPSGGYGWWTLSGGAYNPAPAVVADADSPTGYAVRFRFTGSDHDSRSEARLLFGAHLTEVYIGWNIKFPLNYYHRNRANASDNNKMIAVWGNAYSTQEGNGDPGPISIFEAYPSPATGGGSFFNFHNNTRGVTTGNGHLYNSWANQGYGGGGVSLATDLGVYRRLIMRNKLASGANFKDGIVELWIDGVVKALKTDCDFWDYSPVAYNYLDKMYLLGAANSGFAVTTDIYIQDVAIGPTYDSVA